MDTPTQQKTAHLLRLATYASTTTAAVLIGIKFAAWFATGSLSILASLVDSLMDGAASLINLLAVRYSLKSPDKDHQFGHGKAESLAGLAQASFIAGSAIFLTMHAVERLHNPQPLSAIPLGIGVMIFAVCATMLLLAFQGYVISQTNSLAIKADSLHYKTDLLTNASTLLVLLLASNGWAILDPLCALAIGAYILKSAWQIGHEAMQVLMDRELPEEFRKKVCDIALSHPLVLGVHGLRTRQSGQLKVIQMHLDLDADLPLVEAHAVAKKVEYAIMDAFAETDVTIHQDPVAPKAKRLQTENCD